MVYGCVRTASIISKNFVTVAKMTHDQYCNALIDFPFLQKHVKDKIF